MNPALRDAGLSALVALGLFAPMLGLRTENGPAGLYLTSRPVLLVSAVAAVFFGRLALLAWRGRPGAYSGNRSVAEALKRVSPYLTPALLALALVLPLVSGRYTIDLGILVLTYVMLGWGLNIVVGLAGLLDLARGVWRTRAYGDFWSHVLVAEGSVDLSCEAEVSLWDLAALDVLVTEAGGTFTDLSGRPGPGGGSVLASNGLLHPAALNALAAR